MWQKLRMVNQRSTQRSNFKLTQNEDGNHAKYCSSSRGFRKGTKEHFCSKKSNLAVGSVSFFYLQSEQDIKILRFERK